MGMSLTEIAATPTEVVLKGKTWRVSPLRDRDYGEFERWMQDEVLATAQRACTGLPTEERIALMKHAFDCARQLTLNSLDGMSKLGSMRGAIKMLWLSLRREHPDVTEEEVFEMCADGDTFSAAMDAIERLNPESVLGPKQTGEASPQTGL